MKKNRSDSVQSAVEAFKNAGLDIEPHEPLNDAELSHWRKIIQARALEDWTSIDLFFAWNLSKLCCYLEKSHAEIADQGMTLTNARGTPVSHPALARLEMLTRLSASERTKLHVHAEATVGKSEDAAKRATKQREAGQVIQNLSNLIAHPGVN